MDARKKMKLKQQKVASAYIIRGTNKWKSLGVIVVFLSINLDFLW